MVTTATLQLFKNCAYDIYRNMSNFASLSAQNAYYNGLTKLEKDVVFNKIGDPFILDEDIATLSEYSYGRIQYQTMWWYFQIMDMAVNAQGRTVVSYQLDAWETHRYQGNLKLGAGQVTRIGNNFDSEFADCIIQPPYTPRVKRISDKTSRLTAVGFRPCVFAMVRDNTNDWVYPVVKLIENTDGDRYLTNTSAFAHYIIDAMKPIIENCEIMGMWFSSFTVNTSGWINTNKNVVYYYNTTDNETRDITDLMSGIFIEGYTDGTTLKNTNTTKYYIADERGNVIYRLSDNITYTGYIDMILNMSLSSCNWECQIYTVENGIHVSSQSFQIPCEPLDFYTDSWQTYQATQRQIDIDSRYLDNQNGLVGGLSNIGTNAISGAVAGGLAGSVVPGIGTAIGAAAGAIAGLVGTTATALYNDAYAHPKEQELTDRSYKNAGDINTLCGNGVNGSLMSWGTSSSSQFKSYGAGFKQETYDTGTIAQINNEIAVYGNYVDIKTNDVDSLIVDGGFTAICEVTGVPANWAGQVQERLANGVMFK